MTNQIINPQPNYSGVTIQIANPAVNVTPNGTYCACSPTNQNAIPQTQCLDALNPTGYAKAYPAQYYLSNYNYNYQNPALAQQRNNQESVESNNDVNRQVTQPDSNENPIDYNQQQYVTDPNAGAGIANKYSLYADSENGQEADMTKSQNIIDDISEREAKIAEEKKNTKETKIVALTDEYIKSLENYLNNPNQEIRLMASKEILTRLDEDKDRYDDAALNALLNKMLQDPSKLIRVAALSAFASQLASGNNYTVQLLQNIQNNPNADKEDVLQAADILLKMSAGTEIKNIPNPKEKENTQQTKQGEQ